MPAFTAHYLFACELLPELKKAAEVNSINTGALFMGTQGPDVFLFHRIGKPGKSYADISSRLHRLRPSLLFRAMAAAVNESADESAAVSYAYGFLCHYALDCTVHPFVYAQQAVMKKKYPYLAGFTLHNRVEFGIDSALLSEKRRMKHPNRFYTRDLLSWDEPTLGEITSLLEKVIAQVLPEKQIHRSGLEQAWMDFRSMQALLRDPSGLMRPLLQCLEAPLLPVLFGFCPSSMLRPADGERARRRYYNEDHQVWRAPFSSGLPRTESLPELWEEAKRLAQALVCAFHDARVSGEAMVEATGDKSFLTGEPVE